MKTSTLAPCPDCGSPLHVSPLFQSLAVGHDLDSEELEQGSWHLNDDVDLDDMSQIEVMMLQMAAMTRFERRKMMRDLRRKGR